MKTLKLFSFLALAFLFSHCGTTEPTTNTNTDNSVLQVKQILDTVQGKFYELAQSHLSSTPQEVLVMTADWVKTQPNVASATWFDSSYIDVTMRSGLRTTFAIYMVGSDSISLTRSGPRDAVGGMFTPSVKANHTIVNKSVLIFSPFVGREFGSLYREDEILPLVNKIRNSGKGVSVTLLESDKCTIGAIESFKDYGVVIISTHGFPDAFFSGDFISGLSSQYDTTDALVKEYLDKQIPDGYNKIRDGDFRFAYIENIGNIIDWQKYLKNKTESPPTYRILVNSQFIDKLPPMPNTIVLGNMCYSGWSRAGLYEDRFRGTINYKLPIKTAFTNKNPISYYSYGFPSQLSAPVDNSFAKKMEDTLLTSLIIDGDSTGTAYLNAANQQFTAGQLGNFVTPDMPFTLTGAPDYSFDDCVSVFTDERDGNIYKATCIGKQVWMAENLRFNAPGSSSKYATYGRYYDAALVNDLCPKGWHIPTKTEWIQLFDEFSGIDKAGGALKSTSGWDPPNLGATNISGFTALAAGFFHVQAGYRGQYNEAWFSTATLDANNRPLTIALDRSSTSVVIQSSDPANQVSCRCLKD